MFWGWWKWDSNFYCLNNQKHFRKNRISKHLQNWPFTIFRNKYVQRICLFFSKYFSVSLFQTFESKLRYCKICFTFKINNEFNHTYFSFSSFLIHLNQKLWIFCYHYHPKMYKPLCTLPLSKEQCHSMLAQDSLFVSLCPKIKFKLFLTFSLNICYHKTNLVRALMNQTFYLSIDHFQNRVEIRAFVFFPHKTAKFYIRKYIQRNKITEYFEVKLLLDLKKI